MLRLLVDENFDGDITRGLLRARPGLDLLRLQDVGLRSATDPLVLDWAARNARIVLTHDVNTMVAYAYQRVQRGQPMPGLFVLGQDVPLRQAIDDLLLLIEGSETGEWENLVLFLPL